MVLIDTHVHLNFPDFHKDMEETIDRAWQGNIVAMVNVGTDANTSQDSINLAQRFDNIYAAIGIHPHFTDKYEKLADEIKPLARERKVVAIGEIGLDYFRNLSSHPNQLHAFKSQLDLALQVQKPVILHCRDAYTEMLNILEENYIPHLNGRLPGVIHSFAAGPSYAQKFLKLGFYIGINNLVTYPKSVSLQESVKIIPLDRMVLETDCPYLPPQQLKGERSEPVHVAEVARKVAELKGVSVKQVEDATTQNARAVFSMI